MRELRFFLVTCLIAVLEFAISYNVCPRSPLLDKKDVWKNGTGHSSYRLPKEVVPTSYIVHLDKDRTSFTYLGSVSIFINVLEPTNTVVVHSDGLRVMGEDVNLYRATNDSFFEPILCQYHDAERQFYIIKVEGTLEPGEYVLRIRFEGEIRDDVFGFYRSFYVENNETKWMAVTQFSPTYARRAFPCMDEPHLKAVFSFTINAEKTATSNTRVKNRSSNEYGFEPTPRMSTYQLGWALHDFVSSGANSSFRMWTRGSTNDRGATALSYGKSIYSSLENWISIENPIPKMDQFAVPDFNFHAMENWGMITYRESVVLYEDGITPTGRMVDGIATMAHEYAHTWFGNLVTPMFWDVAWLKEGFASYFQYFAVSMVEPSWGMMEKFVVDVVQPAMLLDSGNHSRVMNGRNVGSPGSIMEVLDFVSYKKGASVIRMLSHMIGESAFRNGLRSYVTNMSYQAATPHDLYEHLKNFTRKLSELTDNVSIEDIMESWTNQSGYPLVTIVRDYESAILTIVHEKFQWDHVRSVSKWWIPLSFTTETDANFSHLTPKYLLNPEESLIIMSRIPSDDWVVFNLQQSGYYRVNYDQRNWQMLTDYLNLKNFTRIHRVNRAALIDDAFNLARAGYVNYSIPFNLSKYLVRETDYEPWVAAANNFKFLNKMLSGEPNVLQAFQDYAIHLLRNMYDQINFTESANEDVTTKLRRELILSTSCLVRYADCLNVSKNLFQNWIAEPGKIIPRDVKSFVYCEGIRNGSKENWYTVMDRWLNADLQIEQELLLQALGCTKKVNLIETYLEASISNEKNVRKQQRMMIVNAILDGDVKNVDHVLKFVQSNLTRIIEQRGYDFLGKIITGIGKAMITTAQTRKLSAFIEEYSKNLGPSLDTAKQALSVALENVKWIKKYVPNIAEYFKII
ncbi:aminopeptidase N-like [Apis cerana]|uniref:aminopeptidase N-like n=1 Tax=Apis cerana TaxID=7461 RepID=UPI002B233734|nr:aminopeptidase N-like [Apis cerana]